MKFQILLGLATLTAVLGHPQPLAEPQPESQALSLDKRAACNSDACVTYYSDSGCTDGLALGSYKPDCSGHCFQYSSFSSIEVAGSTILGVDCVAYSDSNCQNKIGDSGNQHDTHCLENLNGAQSMQCYWDC
ncbi:hypothetical protein MMC28_007294 [Mycoblastus sanguinarius]|nr:hypothetical protein [Mycoblastus sanguinarius]